VLLRIFAFGLAVL